MRQGLGILVLYVDFKGHERLKQNQRTSLTGHQILHQVVIHRLEFRTINA